MARCFGGEEGEIAGGEVDEGVEDGGAGGCEAGCAEDVEEWGAEEGGVEWGGIHCGFVRGVEGRYGGRSELFVVQVGMGIAAMAGSSYVIAACCAVES